MTATATTGARTRREHGYVVRPVLDLATFGPIEHVASELQARIRRTLYSRGEGTVVLCSPAGEVYALMAGELRTDRFVGEHAEWVVGWYATRPRKPGCGPEVPATTLLVGDLQDHTHALR